MIHKKTTSLIFCVALYPAIILLTLARSRDLPISTAALGASSANVDLLFTPDDIPWVAVTEVTVSAPLTVGNVVTLNAEILSNVNALGADMSILLPESIEVINGEPYWEADLVSGISGKLPLK